MIGPHRAAGPPGMAVPRPTAKRTISDPETTKFAIWSQTLVAEAPREPAERSHGTVFGDWLVVGASLARRALTGSARIVPSSSNSFSRFVNRAAGAPSTIS